MKIESLEIHPEVLGYRVRFHQIDLVKANDAKSELWKEAQPYFTGASGHIDGSDQDKIGEEIKSIIDQHNKAEEELDRLSDDLRIIKTESTQQNTIHNPYLREMSTKNKKTVNQFIKEAPRRILKEIRKTYRRVLDTNSVLPASLRAVHEMPDPLKKDEIDAAAKAGEI